MPARRFRCDLAACRLAALATLIDFVRRVVSRLQGVGVSGTASNLAFTTLLALVPLATVTFAVVAHFPVFQDGLSALEDWVVRVLMPGVGQRLVRDAIVGFAEQAARLTLVTLGFLAVTAALLVATIESEINAIFGVKRSRPLARRVVVIVAGVTLGPVVAGLSISATTWLIAQSIDAVPVRESLAALAGLPLPWVIGAIALTLVYKVVPYCAVRWRHALVGGMLASAGFEVAKSGFGWYVVHVPTYRQIYGALAVLPLFMLWIYVCWIIVLVGAAIVSALSPGSPREARR
jgi:membrane protein